jgi:hypothetical protein
LTKWCDEVESEVETFKQDKKALDEYAQAQSQNEKLKELLLVCDVQASFEERHLIVLLVHLCYAHLGVQ